MELRHVFLVLITLQNSTYTLIRRYSRGVLKETYSASSLLGVAELLKLSASLLMIEAPQDLSALASLGGKQGHPGRLAAARHALYHSRPMLVPAIVYMAMNMLSFVAITRIDATTFSMVAQMKTLTTAICSMRVLGKSLSAAHWRAIWMLTLAVMIITYQRGNGAGAGGGNLYSSSSFMLGLGAVALEVMLSGWISTYFEKYLKDGSFSVWARNLQVSTWSVALYFLMDIGNATLDWSAPTGHPQVAPDTIGVHQFFVGWSAITWAVAIIGASGGLLVGFATKHADAVCKTLATSFALVLVVIMEVLLLGAPSDPIIGLASAIALLALEDYREAGRAPAAAKVEDQPGPPPPLHQPATSAAPSPLGGTSPGKVGSVTEAAAGP